MGYASCSGVKHDLPRGFSRPGKSLAHPQPIGLHHADGAHYGGAGP
jgi:hypothetical protein